MNKTRIRAGLPAFSILMALAPAALAQEATASLTASTSGATGDASASVGTKRVHHFVELGFLGGLYFPSKNHSLYGPGYTQVPYKSPAAELGGRAAFLPFEYAGVELEGAVMPATTTDGQHGGFFAVRGHLLGQLPMGSFTPFLVAGLGRLGAGSTNTGTGAAVAYHFGIGAKYALDDFVALRLDVRDTLSEKNGGGGQTSSPEVLLGLSFMIGTPPKEAPPAPPPVLDTDGDGKKDPDDKCPNEAAFTPDGCPVRDSDGDGVLDDKDVCPQEKGTSQCGCPFHDQDGDKVIDELDKCPTEPGPIEGCPDPDADRDGVPVPDDKCPNEPETKNGFEDADGCPDQVPEKVKKFTGVIQGIEFDKAKDTIRPVSTPVLDAAAAVLTEYPALRIMISGHTDTDGDRETNMDLSKRRADAVKAYFVTKGIAADRVETRGAGPDEPIADNNTKAGKQKNRRIEFKLLADAATTDAKPAATPESGAAPPPGQSASPPKATAPSDAPPPSATPPGQNASPPKQTAPGNGPAPNTTPPSSSVPAGGQ